MKKALEVLAVTSTGALCYGMIETLFRGFTHISMGLLGAICFAFIHMLNSKPVRRRLRLPQLMTISALFITLSELAAGELLNVRLGMEIWDYSGIPLNLDGQICLFYSLLWFGLSAVALKTDELLRRFVFKEALPEKTGGSGDENKSAA